MKVENKVIVVTGGGNGIGRELVLHLLNKGAKVAAVDLNEAALAETVVLAGERKNRLSVHVLNITDRSSVEVFPEAVIAHHGQVDGVINNAGIIQPFVRVNDLDFTAVQRVMDVNFYGTLNMTKAFLPHLLKRPEAHVVNISSMGGFLPVPGQSIYGAAKAAVKLMTEGLNSELSDTQVRVTVVFPGAIGTNIMANSGVQMETKNSAPKSSEKMKPLPPAEAARIIVDGMEKNKVRLFVGKDSKLLNILYRISPKFATNLITKKMKSHLS